MKVSYSVFVPADLPVGTLVTRQDKDRFAQQVKHALAETRRVNALVEARNKAKATAKVRSYSNRRISC